MRAFARRHAHARLVDRAGCPFQPHALDRAERTLERRAHDEEKRLNPAGRLEPCHELPKAVLAAGGPRKEFAEQFPVTTAGPQLQPDVVFRKRDRPAILLEPEILDFGHGRAVLRDEPKEDVACAGGRLRDLAGRLAEDLDRAAPRNIGGREGHGADERAVRGVEPHLDRPRGRARRAVNHPQPTVAVAKRHLVVPQPATMNAAVDGPVVRNTLHAVWSGSLEHERVGGLLMPRLATGRAVAVHRRRVACQPHDDRLPVVGLGAAALDAAE